MAMAMDPGSKVCGFESWIGEQYFLPCPPTPHPIPQKKTLPSPSASVRVVDSVSSLSDLTKTRVTRVTGLCRLKTPPRQRQNKLCRGNFMEYYSTNIRWSVWLGGATLPQLTFLGDSDTNISREKKIPMGTTKCDFVFKAKY